jgi:hypothetical protein
MGNIYAPRHAGNYVHDNDYTLHVQLENGFINCVVQKFDSFSGIWDLHLLCKWEDAHPFNSTDGSTAAEINLQ